MTTSARGRPKGVPNKASAAREQKIAATGITPLDYFIELLQDQSNPTALRFEAAKAAAPYVHPRLASVQLLGAADHRFVARLPEPATSAAEWQARHAPRALLEPAKNGANPEGPPLRG